VRLFPSSQAWPAAVSAAAVLEAFDRARAAGIASPGLRLGDFVFKAAPPAGRNAGAIYVTRRRVYLGKILYGRFQPVSECDHATADAIVAAASDPLAAAVAYGMATGRCSCCGRLLTDPESVRVGVGPICAARYFGTGGNDNAESEGEDAGNTEGTGLG
jgi:hypothetical protein